MHPPARTRDPAPGADREPPEAAAPAPLHPVLALQRQIGNRAVSAVLARQGPAVADPPDAAADVASDDEVLKWPETLENARREAGQSLQVTLHPHEKGKPMKAPTLNDQEGKGGILSTPDDGSDKRKQVDRLIRAIKKNRSVKTDFLTLTAYKQKDQPTPTVGYQWGDPGGAGKSSTPKALAGEAATDTLAGKKKLAQQWVWEELSHEGGSLSINAYDEMRFTWGRGMAGAHLKGFVAKVFADAEAKKAFLRYGILFDGDWKVVNVANGAIEVGGEALQLMQAHPEILAAFRYAGEQNPQAIADAQWGQMSSAGAGKVPDGLVEPDMWPKASIQVMAHIHHGGDARGYPKLDYYKSEGAPDVGALWTGWMKLLAGSPDPNGCYVVSSQTHHVAEMRAWGGGAILPAIVNRGLRGPLKMTRAEVGKAADLKDQVAMALPGGATYYVWPATSAAKPLTDEQEKALGGEDRRAFLREIQGYDMKGLLDALKTREKDAKRWLESGAEVRMMSAGDTNEERLWFAMHVVVRKTVPARPKGAGGVEVVPKDQVVTAYEWLGKKAPPVEKIP